MKNSLLLLSNNDIPFVEAQINIHQPRIIEISLIGEDAFFLGCQTLNFSKYNLSKKDRVDLENLSNFEILMMIMSSKDKIIFRNNVMMTLSLMFPDYQIKITKTDIILYNENSSTRINKDNYEPFKEILVNMFGLNNDLNKAGDYNPADERASKIAQKFKNRKQKQEQKDSNTEVKMLYKMVTVLSVGLQKDKNQLMQYTVSQLLNEYETFINKTNYDLVLKLKLAGAKDVENVDNWMNV